MAVLALLLIIGAGVYLRQFQVNPGVVALRPESQQALLPAADQAPLIDATADGISPFSPPEHFGPDTLYEKIDGRAELYLGAGFVSLATQRFTPDNAADKWVELFVYDMGTPANAFSVFSMQRREDARPVDIVPSAYATENALFLSVGKFYLELIGTDGSEALQHTMEVLARRFVEAHGGAPPTSQAPGADRFPPQGLEPDSLQLINADAFGYEQLDHVYTARYRIGDKLLTAFVSERRNADEAKMLADTYSKILLTYGAQTVDGPPPVEGAAVLQFFDTYEIVFCRGRYLAGVHEAIDLDAAKQLAARLAGHLGSMGQ